MRRFRRAAFYCFLLSLLISIANCTWVRTRESLPVLFTSERIRQLPAAEARRGYPVRLQGTVTFYDSRYHILTVQDETGGVFVDSRDLQLNNAVPGLRIDVEGYSGYEEYDAVVVKPRIRVGPPTLLPAARRIPMSQAIGGREDFQYVEVAARFKSASFLDNVHLRFVLQEQGQTLEAIVSTESPIPDWRAGTAVLVRGVASVFRDAQGNPRSGRLHVSRLEDIQPQGQSTDSAAPVASPGPGLPVLTRVSQVKLLTAEEAGQGYPVRVQGVVSLFTGRSRSLILQDSTGGIYVVLREALPPLLGEGTEVEVEGVSNAGDFAPAIHQATMQVLSPGKQFPPLEIRDPSKMLVRNENVWARARGIARSVVTLPNSEAQIDLEVEGQHLPVDVANAPQPETNAAWVDAELEVEGVVGALFDQNRQLQGFHLMSPRPGFVKVTHPAPADPYAGAASPLTGLLQYRPEDMPRHRVKVAGTVSSARLGSTLHLASGGSGLRLQTNGDSRARLGDRVEAVGFFPLGARLPMLEAADLRVLGHGSTEPATDANAEDLMTGAMDSRLVRLEARLVGQHTSYGDEVLSLQSGKTAFTALLEQPQPFPAIADLRAGSMLRLTGVCEVSWDVMRVPPEAVSFRLLLRSPSDVAVVQLASWWTARNTLGVLASMSALMAAVLGWVFILQRRVNRQTALIATRLEHEKELQAQLSQAQRLESVGRLAGGVAHDFNNLLTVINGYSDLALARLGTADPLKSPLDQIRRAGERAANLTQQLLGFSRKQIIRPRPVDLNSIVAEAQGMLQPLLGELIKVRAVLQPRLGQVVADPGQIEQILMNLSANARDAMPRGGTLTIETKNLTIEAGARTSNSEMPPGSYVTLTISDTGAGMSEDVQQHIFEPFFTTKERGRGTGLGLATVYGIVKQNGGWVEVHSELGSGTTFQISLPSISRVEVNEVVEAPLAAASGTESLLVVEDQEDVRKFAVEVLQAHGYSVLSAENSEAALALSESHSEPIDMLITDVVLPGLNGRELAERLKSSRPAMHVLFTSGYTQDLIAEQGVLEPGVAYISKPYTPGELALKVRETLARSPGNQI